MTQYTLTGLLLAAVFCSCTTIPKVKDIQYDEARDLYTADVSTTLRDVVLRNPEMQVLRKQEEVERFLEQYNDALKPGSHRGGTFLRARDGTAWRKYQYLLYLRENEGGNPAKGKRMSDNYYQALHLIKGGDFPQALPRLEELLRMYPEIRYFSDYYFLSGFCYEGLSNREKAVEQYELFIAYAGQNYSRKFNEINLVDPDVYGTQLAHARQYCEDDVSDFDTRLLSEEVSKYWNSASLPGFYTHLDNGLKDLFFSVSIGGLNSYKINLTYSFAAPVDLSPCISVLDFHNVYISAFIPVQLYRSRDHRFGVNIAPFAMYGFKTREYYWQDDDWTSSELTQPQHLYNLGGCASTGFFLLPSLYVGGYFKYYQLGESDYRISIKYFPRTSIGLDLSLWDGDLVAGCSMGRFEILVDPFGGRLYFLWHIGPDISYVYHIEHPLMPLWYSIEHR